jgi:hypothetical protein
LPGIVANFYADSPFQVLLRQKRALAEMSKP